MKHCAVCGREERWPTVKVGAMYVGPMHSERLVPYCTPVRENDACLRAVQAMHRQAMRADAAVLL